MAEKIKSADGVFIFPLGFNVVAPYAIVVVGGQWTGGFFLINAGGLATAAFAITVMRQV
jgi:hypothetical protein